jgi:flavodoxin
MSKILVAYASLTGNTEKMAQYIAEGVRFAGGQAIVKNIADIKDPADLEGFDGYIFGRLRITWIYYTMKTFLFIASC